MHRNLRICSRVLLLGMLTCSISLPAWSQRVPKPESPQSEAAETRPERDAEIERLDRELNRELMRSRQVLLKEAMARLKQDNWGPLRQLVARSGEFLVFLVVTGSLLWILRAFLENWRWRKMVRIQSEMHAKLLEKFGTSQEMLAYVESEAGRRFLELPSFEAEHRQAAVFPYARILWSVQFGVIAAVLGVGLLSVREKVRLEEAATALLVFGTLALMLGIGFLLSAGVSYLLSKSLGLIERPRLPETRTSRE